MNKQLYNALIQARDFLELCQEKEYEIYYIKEDVKSEKDNHEKLIREIKSKKFPWFELLLVLFWGSLFIVQNIKNVAPVWLVVYNSVAILIFLIGFCIYRYKHKTNQINLSKKIENSKTNFNRKENELNAKVEEFQKFFANHYNKYLGFLPKWVWEYKTIGQISMQITYINGLIEYVKNGVETLDVAMDYYAEELRALDAMEQNREEKERLERRYKEQMRALNTIAKNQEKTNQELEKLNNRSRY